jgi:phage-related tail protein
MDMNLAAQEISDFNAEQGELGQERMEVLRELAEQDEAEADYADLLADSDFNPVDSGVFDDDPSPYSGDYSEE